jgi:hypothetical protein
VPDSAASPWRPERAAGELHTRKGAVDTLGVELALPGYVPMTRSSFKGAPMWPWRHSCFASFVAVLAVPGSLGRTDPCLPGRTLERQVRQADAVVLGKAALIERSGCVEGEAGCRIASPQSSLKVLKSWKGPISSGGTLSLSMPFDTNDVQIRHGATVVVFAKLHDVGDKNAWVGSTDGCMYPEGSTPSDTSLIQRLDQLRKSGR